MSTVPGDRPKRYLYPRSNPGRRPPGWWYVGWVIYANRSAFLKGFILVGGVTAALIVAGLLAELSILAWVGVVIGAFGLVVLANSVIGLTLVYGPPARNYIKELLRLGDVDAPVRVADLHIGTYRASYILADLLPSAQIESVDLWDEDRYETERALVLLRVLELVPTSEDRVSPGKAHDETLPLADDSCDAVVLGLGFHEIPAGASRDRVLSEAKRVLKPGGACLLFEHTVDLQSFLVFGTGIQHWVRRPEWVRLIEQTFGAPVRHRRSWQAVDLFSATGKD